MRNVSLQMIELHMKQLVVVMALLASVAAGVDNRAESVVAPDERVPTVHCLSVSDVDGRPKAQCDLVNDTSMEFLVDADAKTSPNYSIEQRQDGHWNPVTSQHESEPLVKHPVSAGAMIVFSAALPQVPEPVRLRLVVYRAVGTNPFPVFSNAVRLPGSAHAGQDDDVPMILCFEISPPKVVHRVEPKYPEVAQRARIQGTVVLEIVIDKNGNVQEARVVRSIPVLDPAAISALKEWKYKPARDRHGHPVSVYFLVSVKFELPSAARPPTNKRLNPSVGPVMALMESTRASQVPPAG